MICWATCLLLTLCPAAAIELPLKEGSKLQHPLAPEWLRHPPKLAGGHNVLAEFCENGISQSFFATSKGRLLACRNSWCASGDDNFVTIALDKPRRVEGVATHGKSTPSKFVRTYTVQYSNSSSEGSYSDIDEVFIGNDDNVSIKSNKFRRPVWAKYIRIVPVDFNEDKCMGVGVFDCEAPQGDVAEL